MTAKATRILSLTAFVLAIPALAFAADATPPPKLEDVAKAVAHRGFGIGHLRPESVTPNAPAPGLAPRQETDLGAILPAALVTPAAGSS